MIILKQKTKNFIKQIGKELQDLHIVIHDYITKNKNKHVMALSISSCCVRMHDYIYTHIILLRTKVKGEECFVRSNVGCLAGSKTNFIVEPAVNHGPVQIIRSSSKVKNASVTSAREDNNVHKHCREEEKTSLCIGCTVCLRRV